MNKRIPFLAVLLLCLGLGSLEAGFFEELRRRQILIRSEKSQNLKLRKIIDFLGWVKSQNPGPGSTVARECYYAGGASRNYWHINLFNFVGEQFDLVMQASTLPDSPLLAELQQHVDAMATIFDLYVLPLPSLANDSGTSVLVASGLSSDEVSQPWSATNLSCEEDFCSEFVEEGFTKSYSVKTRRLGFSTVRECWQEQEDTSTGAVTSVPVALIKKHKDASIVHEKMDEAAYNLALQWIGSMYISARSWVSTTSSLSSFSAPSFSLRTWAPGGDVFSVSLRDHPLIIYASVEPFLDWLSDEMQAELARTSVTLSEVTSVLTEKSLRLKARKQSIDTLRGVIIRIHELIATMPDC